MTVNIDEKELFETKGKMSVKVRFGKKVRGLALGLIIPFILLVVWEAAVRFNWLDAYVFPGSDNHITKDYRVSSGRYTLGACRNYVLPGYDRVFSRNNCCSCSRIRRWLL